MTQELTQTLVQYGVTQQFYYAVLEWLQPDLVNIVKFWCQKNKQKPPHWQVLHCNMLTSQILWA